MTKSKTNGGRSVGYVRLSHADEPTPPKLDGTPLDKLFTDRAGGRDEPVPELRAALDFLRPGDTLVVPGMDSLARSLQELQAILRDLDAREVAVRFVKEDVVFNGNGSQLAVLDAVAEFSRALTRQRQREGIAAAKAKGVYTGRKRALGTEQVQALKARDEANGGRGRAALAREFGISRETLYQYLRSAGRVDSPPPAPRRSPPRRRRDRAGEARFFSDAFAATLSLLSKPACEPASPEPVTPGVEKKARKKRYA